MKLLVISTAPIIKSSKGLVAYAPMVSELDLWFESPTKVFILAPIGYNKPLLTIPFKRQDLHLIPVPALYFGSVSGFIKGIWGGVITKLKLLWAMAQADHIHIRCPGNTSMFACFIQVLFPFKEKTVKYAGNWDPMAQQPLSYRLQKWILKNRILSHNIQVLVYGEWLGQSKNIKPFFTASYSNSEIKPASKRDYSGPLKMIFVGSLSPGKRPEYALELVKELREYGIDISIDFYGEGAQREVLEEQIINLGLRDNAQLKGNQPKEVVKAAYKQAHFLILPSKSEGWPKAVAEAMFWGCIPLATPVSCVSWMLHNGARGILLNLKNDAERIQKELQDLPGLKEKSKAAAVWSRNYTLDKFNQEIQKLLES